MERHLPSKVHYQEDANKNNEMPPYTHQVNIESTMTLLLEIPHSHMQQIFAKSPSNAKHYDRHWEHSKENKQTHKKNPNRQNLCDSRKEGKQ